MSIINLTRGELFYLSETSYQIFWLIRNVGAEPFFLFLSHENLQSSNMCVLTFQPQILSYASKNMLYVLRVDRNKYASLRLGDIFKWKLTRRRGRVADGISGDIIHAHDCCGALSHSLNTLTSTSHSKSEKPRLSSLSECLCA